jgi:hypothetical protein
MGASRRDTGVRIRLLWTQGVLRVAALLSEWCPTECRSRSRHGALHLTAPAWFHGGDPGVRNRELFWSYAAVVADPRHTNAMG